MYHAAQHRFMYWLRHLPPRHTLATAQRLDYVIARAVEQFGGYPGMLSDALLLRRVRLPVRMRGCGFRSLEMLAHVAYSACFVEQAQAMLGTPTAAGYFTVLRSFFGPVASYATAPFRHALYTRPAHQPASFVEFRRAWDVMVGWLSPAGVQPGGVRTAVRGPLDTSVAYAGTAIGAERLQRAITAQLEQVERDELHRLMMLLPPADPRRESWMSVDRLSSQLMSSWPTRGLELEADAFREAYTTYLGAESPACRPLAGGVLPVVGHAVYCDAHGHILSAARLPVETWDECHDAIVDRLVDLMDEAGFRPQSEPRGIFTALIPPAVLLAPGGRPAIIPDMMASVPMPAPLRHRDAHSGPVLPSRRLLWDVKTIFGDSHYRVRWVEERQSGAVLHRALDVMPAYLRHARQLDQTHSVAGTTPIETRLLGYSSVRGLVFGRYGEASADVHSLIAAAASARASRVWRRWGGRTESEVRSGIVASMRRSLGVFVTQEFARHRLRRLPLVGVSRAVLDARRAWGGGMRGHGGGPVLGHEGAFAAQDFFAFQAAPARVGLTAAG